MFADVVTTSAVGGVTASVPTAKPFGAHVAERLAAGFAVLFTFRTRGLARRTVTGRCARGRLIEVLLAVSTALASVRFVYVLVDTGDFHDLAVCSLDKGLELAEARPFQGLTCPFQGLVLLFIVGV